MKISIKKDKCIGCGSCAAICPEVFEIKDGKATIKKIKEEAKIKKKIKEAADTCPVGAIVISK